MSCMQFSRCVALIVFILTLGFSAPNILWIKTYGASGVTYSFDVDSDISADYIFGATESGGYGKLDAIILVYNESGYMWNLTYGYTKDDMFYAGIKTSDGGYLGVGETFSFSDDGEAWAVKFDSSRNKEWELTLPGSSRFFDVVEYSPENYVAVGESNGNALIVFFNQSGIISQHIVDTGSYNYEKLYAVAFQGTEFVAVGSVHKNSGDTDAVVVKFNISDVSFDYEFNYGGDEEFFDVVETPSGYVAVGYNSSVPNGNPQAAVVFLTSTGAITSWKNYGYSWEYASHVIWDGTYFYVTMVRKSCASHLRKLDSSGNDVSPSLIPDKTGACSSRVGFKKLFANPISLRSNYIVFPYYESSSGLIDLYYIDKSSWTVSNLYYTSTSAYDNLYFLNFSAPDLFLVAGIRGNGLSEDAIYMGLDENGSVIWSHIYGNPSVYDGGRAIYKSGADYYGFQDYYVDSTYSWDRTVVLMSNSSISAVYRSGVPNSDRFLYVVPFGTNWGYSGWKGLSALGGVITSTANDVWNFTYGCSNYRSYASSVVSNSTHLLFVIATDCLSSGVKTDLHLELRTSTGATVWTSDIVLPGNDNPGRHILIDGDKIIIPESERIVVVNYTTGDLITYYDFPEHVFTSVIKDGTYYIVSGSEIIGDIGVPIVIKFNESFDPIWYVYGPHNGYSQGMFNHCNRDSSGAIYCVGAIFGYSSASYDHLVAKIASDPYIYSCGVVINRPGVYTLAGNLTATSGVCISVESDDVVINMNGSSIIAVTPYVESLISTNASNVTIANGTLNGNGLASYLFVMENDTSIEDSLYNVTLEGPYYYAIYLQPGPSDFINLTNVTFANGPTLLKTENPDALHFLILNGLYAENVSGCLFDLFWTYGWVENISTINVSKVFCLRGSYIRAENVSSQLGKNFSELLRDYWLSELVLENSSVSNYNILAYSNYSTYLQRNVSVSAVNVGMIANEAWVSNFVNSTFSNVDYVGLGTYASSFSLNYSSVSGGTTVLNITLTENGTTFYVNNVTINNVMRGIEVKSTASIVDVSINEVFFSDVSDYSIFLDNISNANISNVYACQNAGPIILGPNTAGINGTNNFGTLENYGTDNYVEFNPCFVPTPSRPHHEKSKLHVVISNLCFGNVTEISFYDEDDRPVFVTGSILGPNYFHQDFSGSYVRYTLPYEGKYRIIARASGFETFRESFTIVTCGPEIPHEENLTQEINETQPVELNVSEQLPEENVTEETLEEQLQQPQSVEMSANFFVIPQPGLVGSTFNVTITVYPADSDVVFKIISPDGKIAVFHNQNYITFNISSEGNYTFVLLATYGNSSIYQRKIVPAYLKCGLPLKITESGPIFSMSKARCLPEAGSELLEEKTIICIRQDFLLFLLIILGIYYVYKKIKERQHVNQHKYL